MRNKRFLKIVQVVSGEPKLPVPPIRKPPVLPKLIENGFIRCENMSFRQISPFLRMPFLKRFPGFCVRPLKSPAPAHDGYFR